MLLIVNSAVLVFDNLVFQLSNGLDISHCLNSQIFFFHGLFESNWCRGVFKNLIMQLLSVSKIFIQHPQFFPAVLKCSKIARANNIFLKIADAKAPIAPMLNMPRWCHQFLQKIVIFSQLSHVTHLTTQEFKSHCDLPC